MRARILCLDQSFNLEEPASVERVLDGLALAGRLEGELPDTLIHIVNRLVALLECHAQGKPGRQECWSCLSYGHVSYTSSAGLGTLEKAEGEEQAACQADPSLLQHVGDDGSSHLLLDESSVFGVRDHYHWSRLGDHYSIGVTHWLTLDKQQAPYLHGPPRGVRPCAARCLPRSIHPMALAPIDGVQAWW